MKIRKYLKSAQFLLLCFLASIVFEATSVGCSECMHGIGLPDGTCDCYSCWRGSLCDEYASRPPKFLHEMDSVSLTQSHIEGNTLYKVEATDLDEEYCRDPSGCACSNVTYFIVSQDGESSFIIDKYNGEIKVAGESYSLQPQYEIKIGATDDGMSYDTMILIVTTGASLVNTDFNSYAMNIKNGYSDSDIDNFMSFQPSEDESPLHRQRRATISLPTNVTFSLVKYGLNQNITEIRVGHRIQFQLDILFPSGSTDMQVEIFTPDSDTIVMMLCNVVVTVGSNLVITGTKIPVLESLNNSTYNDRAIIALGTVSNSGANVTTFTPSTITVTYEAVMVENPNTLNKDYWVSVGAEFNNENDVWVGQASFTANTINDSTSFTAQPQANFSGPSNMSIGSTSLFYMDLALMYPVMDIKIDVFAPINFTDVMSICDAKVTSVSEAYVCGLGDVRSFKPIMSAEGNIMGYKRMTMNLGRPINKLAREYVTNAVYANQGIISMVLEITLFDDTSLVGNDYWIGATVEIGTTFIWAGQLKVTAVAKPLSQTVNPTFNANLKGGTSVSATKPGIIQVDMTIPERTYADYLLEVVGPFQNDDAIFHMCGVVVTYGDNIGCRPYFNIDPEYRISSTFSSNADILRLNLGRITNVGSYGWNSSTNATANVVSFQVFIKIGNTTMATVGSTYNVSFGMYIGETELMIGQIPITVANPAAIDNITTLNTPQRNVSFSGLSNDYLNIGRTGRLLLNIQTARNTIYHPFNIEFILPNATTRSLGKICKVQLQSVGLNNPCVVKESVEKSVSLVSSYNDAVYDRAVINMDSLCNYEAVNDVTQDVIILALDFILLNDTQFYSDPKTSISAGLQYSDSNLWVAQISFNANLSTYAMNAQPMMKIVDNNLNLIAIPNGFPGKFYIRIKMAPSSSSPLALYVTTLDDALSVCDIHVSRFGDGYPCLDYNNTVKTISGTDQNVGVNRQGYLQIGQIDNVGIDKLVSSSNFDSNTIEVELVIKMTPDITKAANGSVHSFKVTLKYGSGYTQSLNLTYNVTATTNTSLVNSYPYSNPSLTGNVSVLSITGNDNPLPKENITTIVKSESKRVAVLINTVLNSTSQLSVTVSTPVNLPNTMEVQYIGLLDIGDNLACVTQQHTTTTYSPRVVSGAYNDIAELNLGYVCNTGTNTVSTTANQLRVESVIRLLDNTNLAVGTVLSVSVSVLSNNQSILVYTIPLTVGDDTNYDNLYLANLSVSNGTYLNLTEDPINVNIASLKSLPLVFTIPPFTSSEVIFDAIMPVNTSAVMTIKGVKFFRSGRNLPNIALAQNSFQASFISAYNTSQITKYESNLGVISNGGMTWRHGLNQADDDTFTVEVTIQMADHPISTDGSTHKVSFGINVANLVYILEVTITAKRTQTETLQWNVFSKLNTTTSTSLRSEIETTLMLSNSSTAEGQNAVFNIFLPPYVTYIETVVTNPDKRILQISKNNNVITLQFDTIFFTDEIHLVTYLESNSSYLVPLGVSGVNTVVGYQTIANTNNLQDVTDEMKYVNITVTTTSKTDINCNTGPLGLDSGAIKSCQLSSSDDSLIGHDANQGRYSSLGWSPFVHDGKVSEERFFQVYFGNQTLVSKILLNQQYTVAKLKTLKLRYSDDGLAWIEDNNNVILPSTNATQELIIPVPQISRYLRLMINQLDNNTLIGTFGFELIGCAVSSDKPADVCSEISSPETKLSDFSRRSFIKTNAAIFVCDSVQGKKGSEQKCFSSVDDSIWAELDSRVGSMVGYDSAEPRIYAVSSNGLNYMSSLNGTEWVTSVSSDVIKAKALTTFTSAIHVTVDGNSSLNSLIPASAFTDLNNYGATNDGIKKLAAAGDWKLIFSWSTAICCP